MRLVVIGAGAMGLAAAYHASKAGHQVAVLEAGPEPGGMAAHFDFDGLSIERFYHFICKADEPTFELLDELGISDRLRWRPTSMGYFDGRTLHPWGDPISLLRFPNIGLISRLRYGLFAFVSTRRERWDAIEREVGQVLDHTLVRVGGLREALETPLRPEVLRVCGQHLRCLDLDAHQADRALASIAVAGGTRISGGRKPNPGGSALRRHT